MPRSAPFLLLAALIVAACGGNGPSEDPPQDVEDLVAEPTRPKSECQPPGPLAGEWLATAVVAGFSGTPDGELRVRFRTSGQFEIEDHTATPPQRSEGRFCVLGPDRVRLVVDGGSGGEVPYEVSPDGRALTLTQAGFSVTYTRVGGG
ncbi:MAG TPA: hypothetical protein VD962_11590 [Rubricoccaceae bacterium]|nr:hypothetical protein [Rubricoccaceae bacterium]